MDPFSSPTVQLILDKITKKLNQMKEFDKQDIKVLSGYLEISKMAIDGLGKEVQDIFNTVREIDAKNDVEVKKLIARINAYLFSDRLRTLLNKEALPGLDELQRLFDEKSNRFFQLPKNKEKRKKVVENFSQLVSNLKGYILELQNDFFWENQKLPNSDIYVGGSGMLMSDLKNILEILKRDETPEVIEGDLNKFIKDSEKNRTLVYNRLQELMIQFTSVYEQIRTKFR